MNALVAWLTPKLFSWAASYFEESHFESFVESFLETLVKATSTKFDDDVLALYRKKLDE
jgi:hypothetical protein